MLVRNLPGTPFVRASVGAWSSEDDLERLLARSVGRRSGTTSDPALLPQHALAGRLRRRGVRGEPLVLVVAERHVDRAEQVLELLERARADDRRRHARVPSSHASATCETVAPLASAIARASSTARKLRSIARRAGASSRSSAASAIREPAGGGSSRE